MKKSFLASLVLVGVISTANAQYVDDIYYRGSDAAKAAQAEAKSEQTSVQTYNSSNQYNNYNDEYSNDYDYEYVNQNSYIDYDDDSYTTRIRRFQYPMASVGYWGGIYSPYW